MSRKQRERRDAAVAQNVTASKRLRLLVPVMLGLAVVALGVNIYWWQIRPRLEPLPAVSLDSLEPPVRAVLEKTIAAVSANKLSAMSWGELGAVLRAHDFGAEAEVCYRNAEQLDGKDYRWPYLLGVSLVTTDAEQAIECFLTTGMDALFLEDYVLVKRTESAAAEFDDDELQQRHAAAAAADR